MQPKAQAYCQPAYFLMQGSDTVFSLLTQHQLQNIKTNLHQARNHSASLWNAGERRPPPTPALTSAWFSKPSHCPMISTVMLSPPHGRKNDGDRVAIATSTTRVYSHSKARVILTKCKSNHVHSAHTTYGDSPFHSV